MPSMPVEILSPNKFAHHSQAYQEIQKLKSESTNHLTSTNSHSNQTYNSTASPTPFIPKAQADMSTVSQIQGVEPTGRLDWRAPSPPHINVPAASEDAPIRIPQYHGRHSNDQDRNILSIIANSVSAPSAINDWQYEMRRNAQPILSFLHLGPSAAARDINYVQSHGITMLLAIRNSATAQARLLSGEKVANQLGIQAAAIDLDGMQDLISTGFRNAITVINNHLIGMHKMQAAGYSQRPGRVLVFCESGNERSAAVVAAYIMFMYGMDFVSAIQYVQTQRFCVAFDDSLKELLQSYDDILKAHVEVMDAARSAPPTNTFRPAPKRGRSDSVDESGMNLDDQDDIERFGNRAAFAPFRDIQS